MKTNEIKPHESLFLNIIKNSKKAVEKLRAEIKNRWQKYRENPEEYIKELDYKFSEEHVEFISDVETLYNDLVDKVSLSDKLDLIGIPNLLRRQSKLLLNCLNSLFEKKPYLESELKMLLEVDEDELKRLLFITDDFWYASPIPEKIIEKRKKLLEKLKMYDTNVYKEAKRLEKLMFVSYKDELIEKKLNKKINEFKKLYPNEIAKIINRLLT
jgi:hypothetical protein